jgi:uncharacterized protein (TIGR03067 family)
MYRTPLSLLLVLLLADATKSKDPEDQDLLGHWVIVSSIVDGETHKEDENAHMRIDKDTITVRKGDTVYKPFKYRIDTSAKPKRIDWDVVMGDRVLMVRGIYSLDGGNLTLCAYPALSPAPAVRPDKFSAKKGSGMELKVLSRESN